MTPRYPILTVGPRRYFLPGIIFVVGVVVGLEVPYVVVVGVVQFLRRQFVARRGDVVRAHVLAGLGQCRRRLREERSVRSMIRGHGGHKVDHSSFYNTRPYLRLLVGRVEVVRGVEVACGL